MTNEGIPTQAQDDPTEHIEPKVGSLKELIDRVSGRGLHITEYGGDAGLAELLPFPFLALVGQMDMKLALLLSLVNPAVGGVLLIGPRGTGKTTAVRSLVDLLPQVPRSLCHHGCMPEDVEIGGIDAICPDCARKYARGEPLAVMDSVRLVELPLNSRLDDVVGGIDERSVIHERMRLRRGILAQADRNLLYVDEVNLLADEVVDAILDAASQGIYTVRRGPISATYRSRFVLIGSMNPEEGGLRPQIMDRFGLRILVSGPKGDTASQERLEVYRRVQAYSTSPRRMAAEYASETAIAKAEIQAARDILPEVILPDQVANLGLEIIDQLGIDSLRAAITLFEAARAYAAIDARLEVTSMDLSEIAAMALRLRRSSFIKAFFKEQDAEEIELSEVLGKTINQNSQHDH
jgi:magnesium chelatase subunit I